MRMMKNRKRMMKKMRMRFLLPVRNSILGTVLICYIRQPIFLKDENEVPSAGR